MSKELTFTKPVLGFSAYSGTGKTTLLVKLLPLLKQRGIRVAMIKHAHHDFDIDKPGKDSYELRKAGAEQMLIASNQRWALMVENAMGDDPSLVSLVNKLDHATCDLVLVEGFRHLAFEKIELHRPSLGKDKIFCNDKNIIAVASDEPVDTQTLPLLDINDPETLADFIENWLTLKKERK